MPPASGDEKYPRKFGELTEQAAGYACNCAKSRRRRPVVRALGPIDPDNDCLLCSPGRTKLSWLGETIRMGHVAGALGTEMTGFLTRQKHIFARTEGQSRLADTELQTPL